MPRTNRLSDEADFWYTGVSWSPLAVYRVSSKSDQNSTTVSSHRHIYGKASRPLDRGWTSARATGVTSVAKNQREGEGEGEGEKGHLNRGKGREGRPLAAYDRG